MDNVDLASLKIGDSAKVSLLVSRPFVNGTLIGMPEIHIAIYFYQIANH